MLDWSCIYHPFLSGYITGSLVISCTTWQISGFWPHSYFEHILSLDGDIQVQSTADDSSPQHPSLHLSPGRVGVEMRITSQALASMESGSRSQTSSQWMKAEVFFSFFSIRLYANFQGITTSENLQNSIMIMTLFALLKSHGWNYCSLICYERKTLFVRVPR